jgi:putative (di)nucleoside polyphosphate hydrolase
MEIENSRLKTDHQMFRAGVGAVILNSQGKVLALERSDVEGAWQFPQGGLKPSEEPDRAVYREIKEETGLKQSHLQFIYKMARPLAYELPPDYRTAKTGRGQVHYWYLFKLNASEKNITLGDKKEFRAWQWLLWDELLQRAADFRKQVYKKLRQEFSGLRVKD